MRIISALLVVIFTTVPSWGAGAAITLFLDGALVNNVITPAGEKILYPLPASFKEGSLRIKPLAGCQIDRVEIEPGKSDPLIAREIARLAERRGVLHDRLKALAIRESIFVSAAKSQSGKAPRKTKSNPEPLASVRQGTEYAISQLESVYRDRRITETELKSLEERYETLKKVVHERTAKIFFPKKSCRIEISYFRTDLKWAPTYDFRVDRPGEADVSIRPILPATEKGAIVSVVASPLSEMDESFTAIPVTDQNAGGIVSFKVPVENAKISSKPILALSFSFKNLSDMKLPHGKATCFFRGEYLGETLLKGAALGEVVELSFGD
jgi:hypothetical protein